MPSETSSTLRPPEDRFPLTGFALFFGGLLAAGWLVPAYELLTLNQHLFIAVNVMALNFCLGLGGQVSLAQAAFCGIGAYISAIGHMWWPEGALVILPATAVLLFFFGAALSYPLETLGEGFLAMATLGVGLIFSNIVVSLEELTGGSEGMVVNEHLRLFGFELAGDRLVFCMLLGLLLLGAYLFAALRRSRPGRALLACREDGLAAAACGVDRSRYKALAFGVGAAISAMAGAVYAHYAGFISPRQFDLELSLEILLLLVIAGPGRLFAPLITVLALETLLGRMQFLGDARVLFHGLLLGAALLLQPTLRKGLGLGFLQGRAR